MQEPEQALHKRTNPDGQKTKKMHSTREMQIKSGNQNESHQKKLHKPTRVAKIQQTHKCWMQSNRDSFIHCWWEEITGKATGKQFGIIC